jgi:hypothetical protein
MSININIEENKIIFKQLFEKNDDYKALNKTAIDTVEFKKYYSGSDELLCCYEPSLINRLQYNWCLRGNFVKSKPRKSNYHILWYDKNNVLIKIEYFADIDNNYQNNYKEIFIIKEQFEKYYLIFDSKNPESTPELSGIYRLIYNDKIQLIEYQVVLCKALIRDMQGEKYKYNGTNLIEAVRYDTWESKYEHFEFEYNNGYCSSYKRYDQSKINPFVYNVIVKSKDIKAFERFGMYHFSPEAKGLISNE